MTKNIKNGTPPGGLEPPTFRLTAERASRLRHGGKTATKQLRSQSNNESTLLQQLFFFKFN